MVKPTYTLEAINQRLTEARVKCKLIQRGGMLWVQGTFPPKPGSDRPRPYQQKISLGVPASEAGFKKAEREARLIGAELADKAFDWAKYINPKLTPEGKPTAQWVSEFKQFHMERNDLTEQTWAKDWGRVYAKLPQAEPLTVDAMMAVVNSTDRNTRARRETCRKLQNLADYAKVEADLLAYKGSYGPSKVADRDLPTDEEIARQWEAIPNPEWRWAFGIMAAFGLRDHELFFCEWRDDGLFVTQGKTGPRPVFEALYPEWVDAWDLKRIRRPKVRDVQRVYEEGRLGEKVARQFRRYQVGFQPYDLRHCYAVRASVTFDIPIPVAAQLMGHTPAVHLKRYQKHLNLHQAKTATKGIMQRPDRPQAPIIRPIDASPGLP